MHRRSLLRLVGLLAVLAVVAAACSDDVAEQTALPSDPDQTEPDAVDDEPAPTTAAPTTTTTRAPTTSTRAPTTTTRPRELVRTTIEVGVNDHPTMNLIRALTDDFFSGPTGIDVEFIPLGENGLREIVTTNFTAGPVIDVVMIDSFIAPQFGAQGWLEDLTEQVDGDIDYDSGDLLPTLRDINSADRGLFAAPFYAESSIIMYNEQIIDDAGIDSPRHRPGKKSPTLPNKSTATTPQASA